MRLGSNFARKVQEETVVFSFVHEKLVMSFCILPMLTVKVNMMQWKTTFFRLLSAV